MAGKIQKNNIHGSVADLVATQNALTVGNGTAAVPSAGTRAIAATTDQTTTSNAIAGLVAELVLVKADLAALLARINGTA